MSLKSAALLIALISISANLTGCNWDGPPPKNTAAEQTNNPGNNTGGGSTGPIAKGQLQLEVPSQPVVTWKSTNGKTTVIVQYIVRDSEGKPMQDSEYDVELRLDDKPIDVESLLDESAKELEVNLYLSMVLDASFSMTQHTPPAFEPMKTAAKNTFQEAVDIWATRAGDIKFSLIWFDEVINQSQFDDNAMRDWTPADILAIPSPGIAKATKLISATSTMTTYLQNEYNKGVFNGPRDQYVMLVFSDGQDNYSWFDNSGINQTLSTTSGALYNQFGTTPTTLAALKTLIEKHPNLTAHVIGLGSAINEEELQQIAQAGGGIFQKNPSSENIDQLFARVMNEFSTLQTRGAEIPLPTGEYKFTLQVKDKLSGKTTAHNFQFKAGSETAGVIN